MFESDAISSNFFSSSRSARAMCHPPSQVRSTKNCLSAKCYSHERMLFHGELRQNKHCVKAQRTKNGTGYLT